MFKPIAHLENQLLLPGDFFLSFGGKLDKENRWVRLAQLVPRGRRSRNTVSSSKTPFAANKRSVCEWGSARSSFRSACN